MTDEEWQRLIRESADPLTETLVYADWLEDVGERAKGIRVRWMAVNKKTPGPACYIRRSSKTEASWFSAAAAGKPWVFPHHEERTVEPKWCLPTEIFDRLAGFIPTTERDKEHDKLARSFYNKDAALAALEAALSERQ